MGTEPSIYKSRLADVERMLGSGDVLSGFRKIAEQDNCTSEKAIIFFVSERVLTLIDYVNDISRGKVQPSERWNEKIGEIISQLNLLNGLVQQRLGSGFKGT